MSIGVNLAGLEFGESKIPGILNTDYVSPTHEEYDYYYSKGLKTIRLPFRWERIQPVLGGSLNTQYLSLIQDNVNYAASKGMTVLLDVHNYARYILNGREYQIGSSQVTTAHFADLWHRLATVFKGNPGIHGYDLMNEPYDMQAGLWRQVAQLVVNEIRKVDTQTTIYLEGNQWSGAWSWTTHNNDFIIDDLNVVYSAHCYLDRDASGRYYHWDTEVSQGVTVNTGVERLSVFVGWLKQHGFRGHIGEIGVADHPNWNLALKNALTYAVNNHLEVHYWAGGPWWNTYAMSIEPQNGQDAPQMEVLKLFVNAAPPTQPPTQPPTNPPPTQPPTNPPNVSLSLNIVNQWKEGNITYKQYTLLITNHGDKPILSLKIEARNLKIKSLWNLVILNNNDPKILGLPKWMTDYNQFPKGATKEAGFITSSQPTLKVIEI